MGVDAMGRLAWSQLRFKSARLVALLIGMLLATTAFTVLTAASRTSQLRTTGTVSAHFAPAYDILVRPKGARSGLETRTDTVQPNFLSGIYGGITMRQYHQVAGIAGVQVAAPIAMVGYSLLVAPVSRSMLPAAAYARKGRQLYRISTTWISEAGTSRITQPPLYQYVTPNRARSINSNGDFVEVLPDGQTVITCPDQQFSPGDAPFGQRVQGGAVCSSKVNGLGSGSGDTRPSDPRYGADWTLPVLIAAVDPAAEAKLDGLNHAVTSGSYLSEDAADGSASGTSTFPVLASSTSGVDEEAVTEVQELPSPTVPPVMNVRWQSKEGNVRGRTVAIRQTTSAGAYQALLRVLAGRKLRDGVFGYWSVGPVSYRRTGAGALRPLLVHNSPRVWYTIAQVPPMDDDDNQYRALASHAPLANAFTGSIASPQLVGTFNPARITSFDPLSQVPLGAYSPTVAAPGDATSQASLHSGDLLPNENLGGLVSQPVDLITSLSALPALQNSGFYTGDLHTGDPISVIRVRVAGVTGPNPVSLERIKEVAQQIEVRTHLDVDIVAGSSPSPTTIELPAGKFGQPPLTLTEYWVRKGVAVAILTAIDKKSVILFGLILVVCVLFVANSASAANCSGC
jgi:putative ABC transport system permease protein